MLQCLNIYIYQLSWYAPISKYLYLPLVLICSRSSRLPSPTTQSTCLPRGALPITSLSTSFGRRGRWVLNRTDKIWCSLETSNQLQALVIRYYSQEIWKVEIWVRTYRTKRVSCRWSPRAELSPLAQITLSAESASIPRIEMLFALVRFSLLFFAALDLPCWMTVMDLESSRPNLHDLCIFMTMTI